MLNSSVQNGLFDHPLDNDQFKNGVTKLLNKLNSFDSEKTCLKFYVEDQVVGLILPSVLTALKKYQDIFIEKENKIFLNPVYSNFEERTNVIEKVLIDLKESGLFDQLDGWRNERFYVRCKFNEDPKFSIERAGANIFGIKCYGCHINGYLKKDNVYYMWIARRSKTKQTYPGMLDNFVAGGLTAGYGIVECAKKELAEEAGLSEEQSVKLKPVDAISYAYERKNGINMEGEFIFDIKLPIDFEPANKDGEVECFYLMNINQVKNAIISDEFKPNSAVVTLNFLFRKGLLTPDELTNYFEILEMMHKPGL